MALPQHQLDNYGFRRNQAMDAFNQAKLQVSRRRANILQEYGYAADYDEKGNLTNMRIDPTSQYGRFQSLMRSHGKNLDAAGEQSIERGLGSGGGLAAQAESEARYAQGADQAALGRELSGGLGDLSEALSGAESAYNREISDIDYEQADSAWQNEQWEKAAADQAAAEEKIRQDQEELVKRLLNPPQPAAAPARKSSLPKSLTALKRKRLE